MVQAPDRRSIVLVVASSPALAADLRGILSPRVVEVREQSDAPGGPPDVVIAELDPAARLEPALREHPLLVVIRRDSSTDVPRALDAGATDVLATPFEPAVVAARVALACRLAAAEARLESRNAELTTWADRAGHDLMQPLAVIGGMAETLGAAWERLDSADRARMLTSIRNQASRAMAMLDEAVALAREATPAARADPPDPR